MGDRCWKIIPLSMATGLGSGLVPFAPGTAGTVVGFVVAWWLRDLVLWQYGVTLLGLIAVSIWAADVGAAHYQRKDPPQVVIDEIVACLIVMWAMPWHWWTIGLGFLLFRIFDIWKPWPVRRLEALPGGWGVVADDLMAGVYAWLVLKGFVAVL